MKLFREEQNEDVLLADLDRTHRIGKKKRQTQIANHGTIFVKKFLKVKEKLKGKNFSITENLTGYQISVLNEAGEKFGSNNASTYVRRILYKDNNDGQKIKIYYK